MRTFASLDAYLATMTEGGLQLHQFASGDFAFGNGAVRVTTDYPWNGAVNIEVLDTTGTWSLDIRIPAWSDNTTLTVNGEPVEAIASSYARVTRAFTPGDVIRLELDTTVRLYTADARIDATRGSVAIERGPLVYALEHTDLPGIALDDVMFDLNSAIEATKREELLDGIVTLELQGKSPSTHSDTSWPYRRVGGAGVGYPGANQKTRASDPALVSLTAIPYFAWENRNIGPIRVWLPTV